jgi:ribonuclease HI
MSRPHVTIHTDGACKKHSAGGWAAVLQHGRHSDIIYDSDEETTANRMELCAVINALSALICPCDVTVYSDSKYVVNGISRNLDNWIMNGWMTRKRVPVKNKDLWLIIAQLRTVHSIRMVWVKGHASNHGNNTADWFAQHAARSIAI